MTRKRLFVIVAILVLAMAVPVITQAQEPGEGGPIIEGNFSGSVNIGSFNRIRCSGTDCDRIAAFLVPTLIGVNPESATFAPYTGDASGASAGSLATAWDVSEDGLTYTFTMRDDLTWNDGEVITSEDVKFSFEAIASGLIESDLTGFVDEPGAGIVEMNIIDDYTLEVVMGAPACDALNRIGAVYPVPAHHFGFDGDFEAFDYSVMVDHPFDTEPEVTYGPFSFQSVVTGEQIALVADENYEVDVIPAGYIYLDVPDQTVLVERFLDGDTNFIDGPPQANRADIRADGELQPYDYPGNSWDYIGLNLADPTNPQDGFETDEDGNPVLNEDGSVVRIEQGNHPIFGDVRVRRAMQLGINVPEIVQGAVFGEGTQMAANELPTSWALNPDLEPIAFDPDAAAALLDEAGWTDEDGDGVRECNGCEFAEDGTPLAFTLKTNEGNSRRETIGVIVQDQLSELGFEVNFEAIDFNTLIEEFTSQTHDAYILGWRNGFPVDPDQTQLFTSLGDIVPSGFNSGSYYNERVDELMRLANVATETDGCSFESRAEFYYEIQEIMQADQPYVWLYALDGMYAASGSVGGFGPFPNQPYWNVETWAISD